MPVSRPILEIVNEASVSASVPSLSSIFGTSTVAAPTDDTARRLISATRDACDFLSGVVDWEDAWRTVEFSVPAGSEGVPIPADFDRIKSETWYEKNNPYWSNQSMTTARTWRGMKAVPNEPLGKHWRIGADQILLFPTPSETEVFSFEYITSYYTVDENGRFKDRITSDNDRTIFDNFVLKLELKWRILKEFGEAHANEYAEAKTEINRRKAHESGAGPIQYGGTKPQIEAGYFISDKVVLG